MSKPSRRRVQPWRRRGGVIKRAGIIGAIPGDAIFGRSPSVIDDGGDAPIGKRGRWLFGIALAAILVLGVLLVVISR